MKILKEMIFSRIVFKRIKFNIVKFKRMALKKKNFTNHMRTNSRFRNSYSYSECVRRRIITLLGILALCSIFYGCKKQLVFSKMNHEVQAAQVQQSISEKILRFHVLANSDSDEDQAVKLMVRDAVGEYIEPFIKECSDLTETEKVVEQKLPEIVELAEQVLGENGFAYGASAELADCEFPVKTYGDYTFPAGEYRALEVKLGEAKGHNWWCVLYPNMCFKGSMYEIIEDDAREELREVLDEEEYEAVFDSGDYEIRFKILDFLKDRM